MLGTEKDGVFLYMLFLQTSRAVDSLFDTLLMYICLYIMNTDIIMVYTTHSSKSLVLKHL